MLQIIFGIEMSFGYPDLIRAATCTLNNFSSLKNSSITVIFSYPVLFT